MVYQMPCPAQQLLFVASSLKEERHARTEIAEWARANGYCPPGEDQTFVIYQDGAAAREWRLIERSRPTREQKERVMRVSGIGH